MDKYLVTAEARWIASHEHPSGKSDIHTPESCSLSATFDAADMDTARVEAKRRLTEFKKTLPMKRMGGLTWQNKDAKVVSVVFAHVLEL